MLPGKMRASAGPADSRGPDEQLKCRAYFVSVRPGAHIAALLDGKPSAENRHLCGYAVEARRDVFAPACALDESGIRIGLTLEEVR